MLLCLSVFFLKAQNDIIPVDDLLYDYLGKKQVENLRATNPKQLIIENYNLVAYCFLATKMTEEEGTYQMMGDLKNVLKPGKSCDYASIIQKGCINRYDFNLEQHPYKQNVYTLGNTGAYIIVLSKQKFDNNLNAALRQYGLFENK